MYGQQYHDKHTKFIKIKFTGHNYDKSYQKKILYHTGYVNINVNKKFEIDKKKVK